MRFIKIQEVLTMTGVGKTYVYQCIAEGRFPKPIKLGRSSLWLLDEVVSWMEEQVKSRDISL
jgi:prophage regulatory protein